MTDREAELRRELARFNAVVDRLPDASSNRVSLVEVVEKLRDLAQANIDSGEHSDSSVFVGHVQMANAILDAIPNRVCTCVDAGYVIGSDPKCPRHATPNRVQRDVILQAILDEFALWNTPPKATVKMPNRGDASELANAIVRALERAT